MTAPDIQTVHLALTLEPPASVLARIDAMPPADRAQVSPAWLARVGTLTSADPWTCGFAITLRETGVAVGSCGFKDPPSSDGVVEIAYGIDPAFQGRGYATEAAHALVAFAFADDRVRVVCAHTLPDSNASTRVLKKCGFAHVGEVVDPDDGLVWRWEMKRPRSVAEDVVSTTPVSITRAELTSDVALALIRALNAELSAVYSEPGANHFALDPAEVAGGHGAFLVIYREGEAVGCGAVRRLDQETAELKRMYVVPSARGAGLGRRLVDALEAEARALGARRLVLETGVRQHAAQALYAATGFRPIPLYGEYCLSPDTSVCLGKNLVAV